MTVCIAGFNARHSAIIAVSDRRLTYGDIAADVATVEKAFQIHSGWIAMFAGNDIGNVTPILDRVKSQLPQNKPVTRVDVARQFRAAYRAHQRTLIEERVLAPFDLSVRDFQKDGFKDLGPQAFDELRHAVQSTKVDCEFLVCGFSGPAPQIFSVSDVGLSYYDKIGYWAIGSGAWSALSSLAFRKFHLNLNIHEALYQLLEAKFMADTAVPTVGKETYMLIIKRDGSVGNIKDAQIDSIRALWEQEGRPKTPDNLENRLQKLIVTTQSDAVGQVPTASQVHRDSKRGRKVRPPSRA